MHLYYGDQWGKEICIPKNVCTSGENYLVQLAKKEEGVSETGRKLLNSHLFNSNVLSVKFIMVQKTITDFGYKPNEKALLGELFHRMWREPGYEMCPHVLGPEILLQNAAGNFSQMIYLPGNPITLESQRYFFALQKSERGKRHLYGVKYNHDTSFDSNDEFVLIVPVV